MISTVSSQAIISKKHLMVYIFLLKPFLCHSYHPMNKQGLRQNVKPFCRSPCFTYPNALLYDRHKHCPAVNRKNDSYLRGSIIHTVQDPAEIPAAGERLIGTLNIFSFARAMILCCLLEWDFLIRNIQ